MVLVETNFPRGGTFEKRENQENIDFGAKQIKKKKRKDNSNKDEELENNVAIEAISAELLTYKTIQEGMILYGIIKHVDPICLKVSLPGRIVGKVYASSISDSYNRILKEFIQTSEKLENFKPLDQLYSIGDSVYTKVMQIKENEAKSHIEIVLSFKPSDVHQNLYHENFTKGNIFNGAIEEIQDHGYVIESGVKNLRCFLPKSNVDDENHKVFCVGQLVCVKIVKLTQFKNASTAICTLISNENKRKLKDMIEPRLEYLMPSSIVNFTVTKILKDGLQGTIMNGNFTAYVNEHQLADLFAMPSEYDVDSTIVAKILYIMPLSKLVYLSLKKVKQNFEENILKRGTILNASVHNHGTGGIIFQIDENKKAVLSFSSLKSKISGNFDHDDLLSKYSKNSMHKIRIIDYDFVDEFYICTDNPNVLNEKYFTVHDCEVGEFVTVTVKQKDKNNGNLYFKLGNCNALMEKLFQSSQTMLTTSENSKIKCRILATNNERNIVYLTNKPEYMKQNSKILDNVHKAKVNQVFLGTIVKCTERFFIIKFFAGIKGILYKTAATHFMFSEISSFNTGQTMLFRILKREGNKLLLGSANELLKIGDVSRATVENCLENGLEITIKKDDHDIKGLVPVQLITDFPELNVPKLKTFIVGQPIEVACTFKNIFSIRDVEYFSSTKTKTFSSLRSGDMLRGSIKNIDNDIVEVLLPIRNYNKLLRIHLKMILPNLISESNILVEPDQIIYVRILHKEPITKALTVSAKLTDVWDGDFQLTGEIFAKFLNELKVLKKSLKSQEDPFGNLKIGKILLAKFLFQDKENLNYYVELENGVQGIIKRHLFCAEYKEANETKILKEGDQVKIIILWIDYKNRIVYCSNQGSTLRKITTERKLPKNLVNKTGVNAKVLLIFDNFVVCSLKQNENPIVIVPTRMHYNDFESSVTTKVIEGDFCRLRFVNENYPIAVFEDTAKLWNKYKTRKRKLLEISEAKNKKRKVLAGFADTTEIVKRHHHNEIGKLEIDSDSETDMLNFEKELNALSDDEEFSEAEAVKNGKGLSTDIKKNNLKINNNGKREIKQHKNSFESDSDVHLSDFERELNILSDSEEENKSGKEKMVDSSSTDISDFENELNELSDDSETKENYIKNNKIGKLVLPGVNDFWSAPNIESQKIKIESSSEDESDSESKVKKKKRLTAAERFKAEKLEEARIRDIENKYAEMNDEPENADQFDRLTLSDPNNSKIWIKYMAFYLKTTEIDKARIVAKKALKVISFREPQELLNVWVALLNLESNYGTKESFKETFKEALLYNDHLNIYLKAIEILTNTKSIQELNDIITPAIRKFKDNPEIWKTSASALFQVNLKDKAQQLLHRSLNSLPERQHINIIVAFANLNHKYEEKEMAHTLMEQVLTSYPKRVDVWCQYVDMLVKDSLIEPARRTLERAVIQKIPLKKMRTIFKKYLEFEEKYGDETNILKVKELAQDYVKRNEI
ncbi:protein RRP5 homolog [Condylostylus longicornis]|uniref:protein RRP5 homolog n=1 Tax=Condylostylus longicornis TaxID=2530218 RepID=UPI00244DDA14|nr:protein RRP5 homolog [Condylostylus longicornis]